MSASGLVENINFTTNFTEGKDTDIFIVSPDMFFFDQDIDAVIESVTVTLTNPQLSTDLEYLTVDTDLLVVQETAHEITLTGVTGVKDLVYDTALLSMKYNNIADEPDDTIRKILISVFDGRNYNYPQTRVSIEVITFNDPPNIYLTGVPGVNVITAVYNEGTEMEDAPELAPDMVVRDSDSPELVSATVNLVQIFDVGNESIFINTTLLDGTGISCQPASCDGQLLTLTGNAEPSVYQTILRSLKYVNDKQSSDFPSLFDRKVTVMVNDGVSNNFPLVEIIIDIVTQNPRVIIDLNTPDHNYFITYTEDTGDELAIAGSTRVIDVSLTTLKTMIIRIRDPTLEAGEQLILDQSCVISLNMTSESLSGIKQHLFGEGAPTTDYYRQAIDCVTYRNTEDEPKNITRYIDFLFVPGGGAPNDTATTEISFLYINDNSPSCTGSDDFIDLPEDTVIGDVVHTLNAVDIDVGSGDSEVGYEFITGNEDGIFSLSYSKGVATITLASEVNFESVIVQYSVIIEACDMGSPQLCCNYSITFNVSDANDNPPVFVDEPITLSVNENTEQIVTTFNITDADSGINAMLSSLSIDSVHPSGGCINVFNTTLSPPTLLTINGGMDFETTKTCYIVLTAQDAGVPTQFSTTNVTVNAIDQDDKPPEIQPPFSFSVSENNTVPYELGTVYVIDPDSDDNDLTFALVDATGFVINKDTGVLSILFKTDLAIATAYTVTVNVTDPAGNSDTQAFTINVLPVNNDPPNLTLNSEPVIFTEESGVPVTLISSPVISDPDNITLTIDKIYVSIANGEDSTKESLSVESGAPAHVISLTDNPFQIIIIPTNQTNIDGVVALIRSIQYRNTQDEPSPCRSDRHPCNSSSSRTILVYVSDTLFTSNTEEAIVNFQFVNDPPGIQLDTAGERLIEFIEGDSPTQVANEAAYSVSDDDDDNLQSLNCEITNPLNGPEERLVILGDVPAGLIIDGNSTHLVSFTGNSTVASYMTALGLIYYYSDSSDPDTSANRVIVCIVSDALNDSAPSTAAVTFQEINNPPGITLNIDTIDYLEENGSVFLTSNPTITDEDDTTLISLRVEIIGSSGTQHGLILGVFLPPGLESDITSTSISVNGSASITSYISILSSIKYKNSLLEFSVLESFNINFTVVDGSGGTSSPAVVNINLVAVDDNPPVFEEEQYATSIPETDSGTVLTVNVTDADLPTPETPTFSITNGDTLSQFTIVNSIGNPLQGIISIVGSLDYDKISFYQLTVKATSGAFMDTTIVNITVTNENNQNIFFSTFPEGFEVYESNVIAEPLMPSTVVAEDPDGFPITYSVVSSYVSINPNTGVLSTIPPVDREGDPGVLFSITISATDGVSTVTRDSVVTVLDVNEFPPQFDEDLYIVSIVENSPPPNSFILSITAFDADEAPDRLMEGSGFMTLVTDSLFESPFSGFFNLIDCDLYLVTPLDFEETGAVINLTVTASDNASPLPLTSTVIVQVTVININDEVPYFIDLVEEYTAKESPLTDFDLEINGDDPDPDRDLLFMLNSTLMDIPFAINSLTGRIMLTSTLNAESGIIEYPLIITLTDLNTAFGYNDSVTAEIVVIVEDVNDHAPVFEQISYTYQMSENEFFPSPTGDALFTVKANDGDLGIFPSGDPNGNNNVTYSLLGAPPDVFRIDAISGVIYRLRAVDREEQNIYKFVVLAIDNPVSEFSNTGMAQIIIEVIDVNEHSPVADPSVYNVIIPENTSVDTVLETQVSVQWSTVGK